MLEFFLFQNPSIALRIATRSSFFSAWVQQKLPFSWDMSNEVMMADNCHGEECGSMGKVCLGWLVCGLPEGVGMRAAAQYTYSNFK
jgi:hypothetical protein